MQALKIKVGGIKCDNKECDFKDTTVLFDNYADWLNKPCPKCGGNLLTQQDLDSTNAMIDIVSYLSNVLPEDMDDRELCRMTANLDGTGIIRFSEIEPIVEIKKEG